MIVRHVWLGSRVAQALDSINSSGVQIPAAPLLSKLFTHMCLCHQAVKFGTGVRWKIKVPVTVDLNTTYPRYLCMASSHGHALQSIVVFPTTGSRPWQGRLSPPNTLEQVPPSPSLSPPFPLPSLTLHSFPLPLEVGPLIAARRSGGAL